MDKKELVETLKEREEYLEGECYQLADLADEMGGLESINESDSRDAKDLLTAIAATWKALKAIRRIVNRNK